MSLKAFAIALFVTATVTSTAFAAWNANDIKAFRELHDPHVVVRTIED